MLKMIIISHQGISPGYQLVQSCHAVADFAENFKELFDEWKQTSNTMITLTEQSEESLQKRMYQLQELKIPFAYFIEPDIDDRLTALCFIANDEQREHFKDLPLALREYGKQERNKSECCETG
jgi:hypothetical protein